MVTKSILFLFFTFIFCSHSYADNFICEMTDKETSDLLIEYKDNSAEHIYLRSPGAEEWRLLNLNTKTIIGSASSNLELTSVKPFEIENLDWDKQPYCYVEIGTQWLFTFNRDKNIFSVELMPYLQTKDNSCIPPKFKPQAHPLNCNWE